MVRRIIITLGNDEYSYDGWNWGGESYYMGSGDIIMMVERGGVERQEGETLGQWDQRQTQEDPPSRTINYQPQ